MNAAGPTDLPRAALVAALALTLAAIAAAGPLTAQESGREAPQLSRKQLPDYWGGGGGAHLAGACGSGFRGDVMAGWVAGGILAFEARVAAHQTPDTCAHPDSSSFPFQESFYSRSFPSFEGRVILSTPRGRRIGLRVIGGGAIMILGDRTPATVLGAGAFARVGPVTITADAETWQAYRRYAELVDPGPPERRTIVRKPSDMAGFRIGVEVPIVKRYQPPEEGTVAAAAACPLATQEAAFAVESFLTHPRWREVRDANEIPPLEDANAVRAAAGEGDARECGRIVAIMNEQLYNRLGRQWTGSIFRYRDFWIAMTRPERMASGGILAPTRNTPLYVFGEDLEVEAVVEQ